MRHTPGPWTAEKAPFGPPAHSDWRVVAPGSTSDRVKPITSLGLQGWESEANARLIAAAPDMLAVLREAENRLPKIEPLYAIVCEAIKKATMP